jgi:tetratricopeptide (TPR) repeat protein
MAPMTNPSEGKRDFFVSYNKADQAWAEWVGWQLEEVGHPVIIQAWDFRPGHNFVLEMDRAAQTAERTILVLSPNSLASPFVRSEWASAFARDPTGEKRLLVPVRVVACDPQGLLGPINYIDLVDCEEEKAVEKLLNGLKPRGKPLAPPSFPRPAPISTEVRTVEKPARFPGALPPIWNVPHLRNPHFTGRTELLETLHRTLTEGPTALTALSGMGGIGKTQMALEYAYRHHTEFDLVWWLRAENKAILLTDYAALARALKLSEAEEQKLEDVAQAVRRTLEEGARWLLVLDNAHNEDDLRDLLPRGGGGRVLITSRNPSWDRATPLEVPLLVRASSVAFLLKRTGQSDETTAAALAAKLGDLPLALEQAAAFMVRRDMLVADYLTTFCARHEKLWKREKAPPDYPDTVRTTWSLSVARLKKEEPAAVDLLNLCAFLAPEAIPRWLFAEHHKALRRRLSEAAADSVRWGDLVEALRSYSLLGVVDGTITFHCLVQVVTQDGLGKRAASEAKAAVRLVDAALPDPTQAGAAIQLVDVVPPGLTKKYINWPRIEMLLPHALATTTTVERLEVSSGMDNMMIKITNILAMLHRYGGVETSFQKVETWFRSAVALNPEAAHAHGCLGYVLDKSGKHEEAILEYEHAVELFGKQQGQKNKDNEAHCMSSIGVMYYKMGRMVKALEYARRAIEMAPKFSMPKFNLGLILSKGKIKCANNVYEIAMKEVQSPIYIQHAIVGLDDALSEGRLKLDDNGRGILNEILKMLVGKFDEARAMKGGI